jgi:hypothetical protein
MGAWLSKFFRTSAEGPSKVDPQPSPRLAPPDKTLPPEEAERADAEEMARRRFVSADGTTPGYEAPPERVVGQDLHDDEARVRSQLKMLDGPTNALFPSLRQQIQGCIGGTPNFMSPEQASTTFKDPDSITHFMLSMRDVPYIYRQMKPVAFAFRRYLNSYIKLHKVVAQAPMQVRQAENVELKRRLDVKSLEQIMANVENLNGSVERLKMDKDFMHVMGYGVESNRVIKEWDNFYKLFQKTMPEIKRLVYQMYQRVKDQRWDKTGPYRPEGPRGEDDAYIGDLGSGILDEPSPPDGDGQYKDMKTVRQKGPRFVRSGDQTDVRNAKNSVIRKPGKTTIDYVPQDDDEDSIM